MIEVKKLCKSYKNGNKIIKTLKNISFSIDDNEIVVVYGVSGSGKTSLSNIMAGLDFCDSGEIVVNGDCITRMSEESLADFRRDKLGFVFQYANLVKNLTVFENVKIAEKLSESTTVDTHQALEYVGIKDLDNDFNSSLSDGEKIRVALARVIAKGAKYLICDEPTGSLDAKETKEILCLICKMRKDFGITTIIFTHTEQVAFIADKIIKLTYGEVEGIIKQKSPQNPKDLEW